MTNDPAFLFYYSDWLVSTQFMSRVVKGCYIDILAHQADKWELSLEDIKAICGTAFKMSWKELQKKFVEDKGMYYNQKLRDIVIKRKKFSESRRRNRQGGNK